MQLLDSFLSRLLPRVPACPDPTAKQALLDAAIQFCEETSVVQYTSEPQDIVADQAVYDLDIPSQQSLVLTLKAWYGSSMLTAAAAHEIDSILAYVDNAGSDNAERGVPRVFYEIAPGSVGLYPVPKDNLASGFSARVTTRPIRSATSVDDLLYNDWSDAIVDGAAFRIHRIPDQPFSSPAMAEAAKAAFWRQVSEAKNMALRGRVRTSISIKPRPFA